MRHVLGASVFVFFVAQASALAAQPAASQPPAAIGRVVACSSLTDPEQRLACFDREVAAMNQAQRSGDLVAMDRAQVRKTRRSLFGLSLPDLGIFGDDTEDGPSEIMTTIKAVGQDLKGGWVLTLAEGGRWVQIDQRQLVIDPAPGQKVRVRRAALGSYLMNIDGQTAIRVKRVS